MAAPVPLYSPLNHSEESSAPRRRLVGGRPSSYLVVGEGVSHRHVASPPNLLGCRAPQVPSIGQGWASQGVARRDGPGGSDAGRAVVILSASSASIRRPVSAPTRPASTRAGPRDRCPVSSVGCRRLNVQVSSVRPPVSGVGVRCPRVPTSAVSDRAEVMERGSGQAAARLDGRGRGRWLGSGQVEAWPTKIGRMCARGSPSVGSRRAVRGSPSPGGLCPMSHLHHCCSEPAQTVRRPKRRTWHRRPPQTPKGKRNDV
jgi:hypothetical protein